MELYLVRHGEALSPTVDSRQGLSPSGRRDVSLVARFLAEKKLIVDAVFHSPKLRAKQTAEIIASELQLSFDLQERDTLNPNDPIDSFLSEILLEEGSFLVVGHLPFLELVISLLLFEEENCAFLSLTTASVVCLKRQENRWFLHWMISPELLASDSSNLFSSA